MLKIFFNRPKKTIADYSLHILAITAILLAIFANTGTAEETLRFQRLWPALKQPWYFVNPSAVAIDNDGYAYVADTENHRIRKFTENGEFITEWGEKGEEEGQFNRPTGLTSDVNGFIYVADAENHRIQKFNADGLFLRQWGGQGAGGGEFSRPFDIIADNLGFLYVTDTGNRCIRQFTDDGRFVASWSGEQDDDPQRYAPQGIAADEDGNIYVADNNNDRVQKFTNKGGLILEWGKEGKGDGEFLDPDGVAVDGEGFVYVTDLFNHRVQKFTPQGEFVAKWGSEGSGDGRFRNPAGMATDGKGYLYVADRKNNRIQKFFTSGRLAAIWGNSAEPGEFNLPFGVALDKTNGFLYVADTENHRIQKFTLDGVFVAQWGQRGISDGELYYPNGIDVDRNGRVWVANTGNDRIDIFSADGVFERSIDGSGGEDDGFSAPFDLAVTSDDAAYVLDTGNDRVQKWTIDGEFVRSWGGEGKGTGKFDAPKGIAISADGVVYVADTRNHRVQKFTPDGEFVATWGEEGDGPDQFRFPRGIAVEGGSVYVSDTQNHRIRKFDADGRSVATGGALGGDPGQLRFPSRIDVGADGNIYIADTDNHRIQVFRQAASGTRNKAVIVAGGGPYPGNRLWSATRYAANFAYRALTYQGYDKETIFYLSPEAGLDLDNNGEADDVDAEATNERLGYAITEWAADAANVVIFLTDHGKAGSFRMNADETLSATRLGGWLDALQAEIEGSITLVYDACNSGGFLAALAAVERTARSGGRIVITSTDSGEDAYFVQQGSISFSGFFWSEIFNGRSVKTGFQRAAEAMAALTELQHPRLDANGNGVGNEAEDFSIAEGARIVNGTDYAVDFPAIGAIFGNTALSGASSAVIWADGVTDDDGVSRVWATILPPTYDQGDSDDTVLELPSVDLLPVGGNRFEAEYRGFTSDGVYFVRIYARDNQGNTSVSDARTVTVADAPKDRAIIVSGKTGSEPSRAAVESRAEFARQALISRGIGADALRRFTGNAEFANGETTAVTKAVLQAAVTQWNGEPTRNTVIYLVGEGGNGAFRLNDSETLAAEELDSLLDGLRETISGHPSVFLEFGGATAFPAKLTPPSGEKRIVIADETAASVQAALDETAAFSGFFWRSILAGYSVGAAFRNAGESVRLMAGLPDDQLPLLDDSGNGIANERIDGRFAEGLYIGDGIETTDDAPIIQGIIPEIVIDADEPVTVWVDGIVSANPDLKRVWAVMTQPAGDADVPVSESRDMAFDEETGRYVAELSGFPHFGNYPVAIYAQDANGNISVAKQTSIFRRLGQDVYETDNAASTAKPISVNALEKLRHSLHDAADADWLRFYAVDGEIYAIRAAFPDGAFPLLIRLFDERMNLLETWTTAGDASEFIHDADETGLRLVQITLAEPESFNPANSHGYDIEIFRPVATFLGFAKGTVIDSQTGQPVASAAVRTTRADSQASGSDITRPNGRFLLFQEPGIYTVQVQAAGYRPTTARLTVSELGTTVLDVSLTRETPAGPQPPPDTIPSARIIAPASNVTIEAGESVEFRGAVSGGEYPLSLSWNFAGVAPDATVADPGEINFPNPGVYQVRFTVTDADGDRDVAEVTITVTEAPTPPTPDTEPTVTIVSPPTGTEITEGDSLRFSATIENGGSPLSYLWEFGDGIADSTEETPEVTFPNAGDFAVTLTVTDSDGDTANDSITIVVNSAVVDVQPIVTILTPSVDITIIEGESGSFSGNLVSGNPPIAYQWRFDGAADNSDSLNPGDIIFPNAGIYAVSLTATDADGDTAIASVTVTVAPLIEPKTPNPLFPGHGATEVSRTPTLQTTPFAHTKDDYSHAKTRWQISTEADYSNFIMDIETENPVFFTQLPVPQMALIPEMTYFWRAKFYDNAGNESEWSEAAMFVTGAAEHADQNQNGIPDAQEVAETADMDGDGTPDAEQAGIFVLRTAVGDSRIGLKAGENVAAVEAVESVDPATMPVVGNETETFPLGMIACRLRTVQPGVTAAVTLFFEHSLPASAEWIHYDSINGWRDHADIAEFSTDRRSVTLKITDGEFGDADGTVNGVIVDPSGFGTAAVRKLLVPSGPAAEDVGGAGCFVDVAR